MKTTNNNKAIPSILFTTLLINLAYIADADAVILNELYVTSTVYNFIERDHTHTFDLTLPSSLIDVYDNSWAWGTTDGLVDRIRFTSLNGPTDPYTLIFSSAKMGRELTAGVYLNAGIEPSEALGSPGLWYSNHYRTAATNRATGSFTILEAIYDYSGSTPQLISFAAIFEQSYTDSVRGSIYGEIYYNYDTAGAAVPLPPAAYLLGSALVGLFGAARRKTRRSHSH